MSAITSVTTGNLQSAYAQNNTGAKNTEAKKHKDDTAAVYEKSSSTNEKPATYNINKMSEQDRTALVNQMKADADARAQSLMNIVKDMMNGQGKAFSLANGDDSIWKFLASGDFEVDPETAAKAKEDISEDGYWGIKQTSQRLFDFASALAGDDPEKMKKMQDAMMKGFKEATGAWGKDLPEISQNTIDAANKLFEDYYKSKEQ